MNEKTTISFKEQTGLRISKDNTDITTGKVIINGIEITSVEDWEKVTHSIVELQQENARLKDKNDKIKSILENQMNYREFVDMINAIEDILKEN